MVLVNKIHNINNSINKLFFIFFFSLWVRSGLNRRPNGSFAARGDAIPIEKIKDDVTGP